MWRGLRIADCAAKRIVHVGLAPAAEITPNRCTMRTRLLLASVTFLAAAACSRSTPGSAPSASSAPTPSAAPAPPPAGSGSTDPRVDAAPTEGLGDPPRLADADIQTLESGLKCKPGTAPKVAGPCKVLVAMEKCNDWQAVAPSGNGLFIGHGWQVAGTATALQVTVLRSHTVPQTDVKPWQLPAKIAIGAIGKDAGPAFAQAEAAITAFAHRAPAPAKNAAVDFLKQKSDWTDESVAAKTMGSMVETFSDRPTYLCQGADQQVELVQQASADIGLKSDGLYAELWPVSP
jgi:hypothetical protein